MPAGIYVIRNRVNGYEYVGQTEDFQQRWYDHRKALQSGTHGNPRLQNSWRKYGADAFEFEVVEAVTDLALLNEREAHHAEIRQPIYNLAPVGQFRRKLNKTQSYSEGTAMAVEIAFMEMQSAGEVVTITEIARRLGFAEFTVHRVLKDRPYWTEELRQEAHAKGRQASIDTSAAVGFPNLAKARETLYENGGYARHGERLKARYAPLGYPNLARAREVGAATGANKRGAEKRRGKPHPTEWHQRRTDQARADVLHAYCDPAQKADPFTLVDVCRKSGRTRPFARRVLRSAGLWSDEDRVKGLRLAGQRANTNKREVVLESLRKGRERRWAEYKARKALPPAQLPLFDA